ncbi:hypothetical protein [Flavitalea sp.]|nr:hypothetical protein [Flavitalea sp.]
MEKKIETAIFRWKAYYFITAMVGLVVSIFLVQLFRKTIIPYYVPLLVMLFVGIFTFFVTKRHYRQIFPKWGFLSIFTQSTFSWGFIACYLFVATNYYWADGNVQTFNFVIEKKSSLPGSRGRRTQRQPVVTIQYFGFAKELVFRHSDTKNVASADSVKVSIKEGL